MVVSRCLASARTLYPPLLFASRPRSYASQPKNPVRQWYSTVLPAMFPISLLASAVYTALLLAHHTLLHEKTMEEQAVRLAQLEAEVDALHRARS